MIIKHVRFLMLLLFVSVQVVGMEKKEEDEGEEIKDNYIFTPIHTANASSSYLIKKLNLQSKVKDFDNQDTQVNLNENETLAENLRKCATSKEQLMEAKKKYEKDEKELFLQNQDVFINTAVQPENTENQPQPSNKPYWLLAGVGFAVVTVFAHTIYGICKQKTA